MIENIYIRVDANSTIGTGHLVRTEILADELSKDNLRINFICKNIPNNDISRLENKAYTVSVIDQEKSELESILPIIRKRSIVIIDSDNPEFYTKNFQTNIRRNDIKLMMITFYHEHHFYADIVLNQNIMALGQEYSSEIYSEKLLGPEYVILKNDYRLITKNLSQHKFSKKGKVILLTFGGVDQPDRTKFVYQALLKANSKIDKIIIVQGSMYKKDIDFDDIVAMSKVKTEIYKNTPKMPYLLAESDVVFNSGGLTVWESGVLKSLNVILAFSDREQIGGRYIGDNKLGFYWGTKDSYSIGSLSKKIDNLLNRDNNQMIENLFSKIDVNGISKVVNVIKAL